MLCCTTAWFKQLCGFASWPFSGSIYIIYCSLACVANVSNRLIVWKLERAKKKRRKGEGRRRKCLPTNPTILEKTPWYFTVRFICKLTARQNRTDYPWITRFVKLLCSLKQNTFQAIAKTVIKKVYDKRKLQPWAIAVEFLVFYCVALSCLRPWRNVKNDLSRTIHSAGCKFCRVAAAMLFSPCRNVLYNACR